MGTMLYSIEIPAAGGNTLFANRLMTYHIEDLGRDESDLVLWDNRCTLHARRDFDPNELRWMRRVTIRGDRPR